jgi:serine phosphatase RsbU (regulator of sigma subunit)
MQTVQTKFLETVDFSVLDKTAEKGSLIFNQEEDLFEVTFNSDFKSEKLISNEFAHKQVYEGLFYAKKLQEALIPKEKHLLKLFDNGFIYARPKSIVSGDFYWFTKLQGKIVFFIADCVGYGVPAAFMSVLGTSLLSHIVHEENNHNPALILQRLDYKIRKAFNPNEMGEELLFDQMDAAVCVIDYENFNITYSGAQRPLYLSQQGEISVYNGSKHLLGGFFEDDKRFENKTIDFVEGDTMYLFTDGYQEQCGKVSQKKYSGGSFKNFLASIQHMPMIEQKVLLHKNFENWKDSQEQTDDVLIIGIQL